MEWSLSLSLVVDLFFFFMSFEFFLGRFSMC
jgi:hypothetical protein